MTDEYVVQEELASIEYALLCYDYGKLDEFLKTGNEEASEDYINCFYGAMDVATDFFESVYYEISNETKFYFGYRAMVEYYRLCRIHSSKHGLKLRNDPYMKEALRFVQGMFDFGYNGGYSVHLQTKINHEWASGLVIHIDNNYFTAEFELAEALLEIGAWYEESCRRLREELLKERTIRLPALPPHNAEEVNVNNENDLLIRISPESRQILVESTDNGVKSVKEILPETFLECVKNSIAREKQRVVSGFLPQNCFHVSMCEDGARDYCIWHPRLRADISYFGTEYNDFPLPRLVFGVRVSPEGKICNCRLGVVRDEPPRETTPMYVYPFSNVAGFGLCTGNNELPVYKNRSTLATLPDYLLRLPNNNDSFNALHNKLRLGYRDLLEHLKKKDPAYYYSDVLVSNGKTLKDFIGG